MVFLGLLFGFTLDNDSLGGEGFNEFDKQQLW
jgi:hypothetical protein